MVKPNPASIRSLSLPRDLWEYIDKQAQNEFIGRSQYIQTLVRKDMLNHRKVITEKILEKTVEIEKLKEAHAEVQQQDQQNTQVLDALIHTCKGVPYQGEIHYRTPEQRRAWAEGQVLKLNTLGKTVEEFLALVVLDIEQHPIDEYYSNEEFEAKRRALREKGDCE